MREEITDETAINHFKKTFLKKIPLKRQEELYIVVDKEKYPVKDILKHMLARDKIGRREIEIEKEYMRWLRRKR